MEKSLTQNCHKVHIVILIYNGMKWMDDCFKSISETNYHNFQIIAIDNHSSDRSAEYVRQSFKNVIILENKKNLGTSVGNNIGIRHALKEGADYVVIFNQDIKVQKDWLTELIKVAESSPQIGILSPLQYDYEWENLDKIFQKILKETRYFEDFEAGKTKDWYSANWAIGASICVRRKVFETIGLFDPLFFMFEEDMDLCRRALFRGFEIAHATRSKVFHFHVHHNKKPSGRIKYIQRRNKLIFLLKDPGQSFSYNLKNAFLWTNWSTLFQDIKRRDIAIIQAFLFLLWNLPLIYYHYQLEKSRACYL